MIPNEMSCCDNDSKTTNGTAGFSITESHHNIYRAPCTIIDQEMRSSRFRALPSDILLTFLRCIVCRRILAYAFQPQALDLSKVTLRPQSCSWRSCLMLYKRYLSAVRPQLANSSIIYLLTPLRKDEDDGLTVRTDLPRAETRTGMNIMIPADPAGPRDDPSS